MASRGQMDVDKKYFVTSSHARQNELDSRKSLLSRKVYHITGSISNTDTDWILNEVESHDATDLRLHNKKLAQWGQ